MVVHSSRSTISGDLQRMCARLSDDLMLRRIELRVPAETVQRGELFLRVLAGIDRRGNDIDRAGAAAWLDDLEAYLTERQRLGNT